MANNPKTPTISVLMPVYNGEKYLSSAIESVLGQSYTNFEFIIVNDGSTDGSKDIILSYTDERIIYVENEQNLGIVGTRNTALNIARGSFYAILDCDDISEHTRLEKQLKFLQTHSQYIMCGTWAKSTSHTERFNFPTNSDVLKCSLLFQCPFIHSSVMVSRSALKMRYNTDFPVAHDYEMWIRLSKVGKLANLGSYLTRYRIHAENVSHTKAELQNSKRLELFKQQLAEIGLQPSEKELELHGLLANVKQNQSNLDEGFLDGLKGWMRKIYKANLEAKSYSKAALSATLWFRWILACHFLKQRKKILSLGIPLPLRGVLYLLQLLWQKK